MQSLSRIQTSTRSRRSSGTRLIEMLEGRRLLSTTPFNLSSGSFSQNWSDGGLISANDDWANVPSIVGYLGENPATTTTGTDPQTLLNADTVVDVIANQLNPNTLTNGGVAEFDTLADKTVALQGSGTADFPHLTVFLNATGRENLNISYNLRDVDGSVDNSTQQVALQYRVGGSGSFVNVPAGYVADATSGPSLATLVTPVNVALPSEVNGQSLVEVRIMTTNAPSNDEWVGIDDIAVSSSPATTQFVGFDPITVPPVSETAGNASVTVTRSTGTGSLTVNYATSNLTALSGSDYTATSGTLTFNAGETTKNILVPISDNPAVEPTESFRITLSGPSGGATLTNSTIDVSITDNDKPVGGKLISGGPLTEDWNDVDQIVTNDDWSGVPYFFGYRGDGGTVVDGADPQTVVAPLTDVLDVNASITDTSAFFTGGVAEFEDPLLGDPSITLGGSSTADSPFILFEVNTTGVSSVDVAYDVRDMDYSADNAVQQVALQYRVGNTGDFINIGSAFVADATEGLGEADLVTPVSATLPAAAGNKTLVQIRVITANAIGGTSNFDEAVGIDNIVVQATPAGPGTFSVGSTALSVTEGTPSVSVEVQRSGGSTGSFTVGYSTANGTATAGSDYTAASGTLTFASGETTKTVVIPIINNSVAETKEAFTFTLAGGTGTLGANVVSTITINDDDLVKLSDGPIVQNWNDANLITQNNDWSGVLGIRGYQGDGIGGTNNDPNTVLASGTDAPPQVFANQLSPNGGGSSFTGGVAEFDQISDRTVAIQGSSNVAPFLLFEFNSAGFTSVDVEYDVRDIETTDPAVMEVVLQYRLSDTGTWTNVPAAYVSAATEPLVDTKVTHVDVNLAAIANKSLVQLRVMTVSEEGFDQWVGIDNINIVGVGVATLPVWLDVASTGTTWNDGTQTLTVTGTATIIDDPEDSGDLPIINASGVPASVVFNPTSDLAINVAQLNLANGAKASITSLGGARTAANHRVVIADAISIDTLDNSFLDITDNDVIVDYTVTSPAETLEGYVRSGFAGEAWNGAGIVSSIAGQDPNFVVGIADNALLSEAFGPEGTGIPFSGQDVDLESVLIKFTHRADLNLDGNVSFSDASVFGTNYQDGAAATWSIGDVDFDGLFTFSDAAIFGTYYSESLPQI